MIEWLMLASLAPRAADLSSDIELTRWTLAEHTPVGMRGVQRGAPGSGRLGLGAGYADTPLSLITDTGNREILIAHRQTAEAAARLQLSEGASINLFLPAMRQWGSSSTAEPPTPAALGDPGLDLQLRALDEERVIFSVWAGIRAPLGTREAWAGEGSSRLSAGLLARISTEPVLWTIDAGMTARPGTPDLNDVVPGSEAHLNLGAWAPLPVEHLALTAAVLSRFTGASTWLQQAPVPVEALAGAQLSLPAGLRLDLSIGHGLTAGVGTSAFRMMAGASWGWAGTPTNAAPPQVITAPPAPPPPTAPAPEPIIVLVDRGVRLTADRLVLEDTSVFFARGSAALLPHTDDAIALLAETLAIHPEIASMVIEGHASAEGAQETNQRLSEQRAQAVYRALVSAGVSAKQLSYRGMGEQEADPLDPEQARRVTFFITYHPQQPAPAAEPMLSPELFEEDVP